MNNNLVYPNYEHSILNLINSILKYYNVKTNYNGLNTLSNIFKKEYKNVVLLVLDGMGENFLEIADNNGFFMKNKIDNITSVFPSTTTAAMTTFYSGKPPIETRLDCLVTVFQRIRKELRYASTSRFLHKRKL